MSNIGIGSGVGRKNVWKDRYELSNCRRKERKLKILQQFFDCLRSVGNCRGSQKN
jgi:hypothetical protein